MDLGSLEQKIKSIRQFAGAQIRDNESKKDFLQFCVVGILDTKNTDKCNWYYYVDYLRDILGRNSSKVIKTCELRERHIVSDHPEDALIEAMDAKKIVAQLLQRLPIYDRLIIKFIYFDELSAKDVADIFQVTEAAISQKRKEILKRLKKLIRFVEC